MNKLTLRLLTFFVLLLPFTATAADKLICTGLLADGSPVEVDLFVNYHLSVPTSMTVRGNFKTYPEGAELRAPILAASSLYDYPGAGAFWGGEILDLPGRIAIQKFENEIKTGRRLLAVRDQRVYVNCQVPIN